MDLVFAYLDPGSGSLIIQALIAGIVAIPVVFRHRIAAAVRAVRGTGSRQSKESVAEPTSHDPASR